MSEAPAQSASLTINEFFERVPERTLFVIIGILQGVIIAGLAEIDNRTSHLVIYFPARLLVLVWPILFMLSFRRVDRLRALAWVSGFCALLVLLALYTGWQATPLVEFPSTSLWFSALLVLMLTMFVVSFVALPHLQSHVWRMERSYDTLFTLSWRNFLTLVLSAALTLAFWLVLYLWESLFKAIGIDFFDKLFQEEWFLWPVLAAVFAFGLSSFRNATAVIDSISSFLGRLAWLLLPLLMFAVALFLLTLTLVGLQPLWDNEISATPLSEIMARLVFDPLGTTTILMAANFFGLLFLNAVYRSGERIPYPVWMHRVLTVGIALLPILSALACYGIALRVGQYGWTIHRCWPLLIVLLMACFSLGYVYAIIRQRTDWHGRLPQINKFMSWVVLVSLLLTASPLADFRAISAWSHIGRIEAGEAPLYQFDDSYVELFLARPGYLRTQSLLAELDETNPENARQLRHVLRGGSFPKPELAWSAEQKAAMIRRPDNIAVSDGLWAELWDHPHSSKDSMPQILIRTDLNDDDRPEYIAILLWSYPFPYSGVTQISPYCLHETAEGWSSCGYDPTNSEDSMHALIEELASADIEAITPLKSLRIGGRVFDFN